MRFYGIAAVAAMAGLAALQSILGGAPEGDAARPLALTQADICPVEAMTLPVIRRETRMVEVVPAHTVLAVTPAVFGTRTETLTVVPAHREGATFFTEPTRVIVSEPTRRLRPVAPIFEAMDALGETAIRPRVVGGKLVEEEVMLAAGPTTELLLRPARIEAVRINAGLDMRSIQVIDEDGEGAPVPAETVEIEVRTVEAHPKVTSTEVAAVMEEAEIEVLAELSARVEVPAVCTMAGRPDLIAGLRAALSGRGDGLVAGEGWSAATIDAMAAAQAAETGYVSPYLLVETLKAWMPDLRVPEGDAPVS